MRTYLVKLNYSNMFNSNEVIILASDFKVSDLFNQVTFTDVNDVNVALFKKEDIKYIILDQGENNSCD